MISKFDAHYKFLLKISLNSYTDAVNEITLEHPRSGNGYDTLG